jgi:hypothetical protein
MKRYTPKLVSKWIADKSKITHARNRQPFPGNNPTRILFSFRAGNQRLSYFGKPCKMLHNQIINVRNFSSPYEILYVEFDRAGIFHMYFSTLDCTKTNLKLWEFYHPEVRPETCPNWLKWPYRVTKDHQYRIK